MVWSMRMNIDSGCIRFRLPVRWDIAARVLKHTARNGSTRFEIQRQGNGYLRLKQYRAFRPTIILDVRYHAELDAAAVVKVADMTRGLRLIWRDRQRVEAMIDRYRSDAEFFATRPDWLEDAPGAQTLASRRR